MSFYDDDPYGDLDHVGPNDADLQMAQWTAEANRLAGLRKQGVCTHSSSVGASDTGEVFYAEQENLKPGQVACTEHTGGCKAVFDSREAWHAAHMAA